MLPDLVQEAIRMGFQFPENHINCQVATLFQSKPHVRTMMLYDIAPEGQLIFLTQRDTQKWRDLMQYQECAVCFFSTDFGQIIAEGRVSLATNKQAVDVAEKYWNVMPENWRRIYLKGSKSEKIPDSFGVMSVIPVRWEILRINTENYLLSERKQIQWRDGAWIVEKMQPV